MSSISQKPAETTSSTELVDKKAADAPFTKDNVPKIPEPELIDEDDEFEEFHEEGMCPISAF